MASHDAAYLPQAAQVLEGERELHNGLTMKGSWRRGERIGVGATGEVYAIYDIPEGNTVSIPIPSACPADISKAKRAKIDCHCRIYDAVCCQAAAPDNFF